MYCVVSPNYDNSTDFDPEHLESNFLIVLSRYSPIQVNKSPRTHLSVYEIIASRSTARHFYDPDHFLHLQGFDLHFEHVPAVVTVPALPLPLGLKPGGLQGNGRQHKLPKEVLN